VAKEAENPEQAVSQIEAALRSMETLATKPAPTGKVARPSGRAAAVAGTADKVRRPIFRTFVRWVLAVVALATLPLLALVHLSVFLYTDYGLWPWVAVVGGAAAAAVVMTILALIVIRITTGSFKRPRYLKRAMIGIVIAFCGYSALFISASNVKTEHVAETYTSLHPSLRLALSTWILADSDLVITDAERTEEDYTRMGLPRNEGSLHLQTSSGYVHAVDLRTIGRPEWRNFLTTLYFKSIGFDARRHVGTADHLHVSLPVSS